ncbi:helix-turn-helix transcriptional regulator [Priestia flexa]|uniref:helix-turn-helix domain-containing protein n=1 Tax=Priestia flexa TaxID=86664 RepID=UPI002E1E6440|nr:helix-turn-helix transcriptional regulator [Priestia flexa]
MGVERELLFSEIIKIRRKALDMNLGDLSILKGLSPSFLYRLESGERHQPSVQTVAKNCTSLEI